MLSCGQCYNADHHRQYKGEPAVKQGYILPFTDTDPAQPADQTMDGREQIVRVVHDVQKLHQEAPQIIFHDLGANIGGGNHKENDHADQFCDHIRTEELIALLLIMQANNVIVCIPEQIAAKVDTHRPGHEGENIIDRKGHIVMMPGTSKQSGEIIGEKVPKESKQENDQNLFFIFPFFISFRRSIWY